MIGRVNQLKHEHVETHVVEVAFKIFLPKVQGVRGPRTRSSSMTSQGHLQPGIPISLGRYMVERTIVFGVGKANYPVTSDVV